MSFATPHDRFNPYACINKFERSRFGETNTAERTILEKLAARAHALRT